MPAPAETKWIRHYLEQLDASQLREFHLVRVAAEKPLVINDEDRRKLEQMFQINISTPDRLVSEITRALTVDVGGLQVILPPRLLERLRSRAIGVPFETFLKDLIIRSLEEHVGLR